jgi:hypothetical protein
LIALVADLVPLELALRSSTMRSADTGVFRMIFLMGFSSDGSAAGAQPSAR